MTWLLWLLPAYLVFCLAWAVLVLVLNALYELVTRREIYFGVSIVAALAPSLPMIWGYSALKDWIDSRRAAR